MKCISDRMITDGKLAGKSYMTVEDISILMERKMEENLRSQYFLTDEEEEKWLADNAQARENEKGARRVWHPLVQLA